MKRTSIRDPEIDWERAIMLKEAGIPNKDIAEIMGIKRTTVDGAIYTKIKQKRANNGN